MRWAEVALFLVPFALYAVWRIAAVVARPGLVWGAVAVVAVLAAVTVLFGLSREVAPNAAYVPAHIVDGKIVPGHGAPRDGTAAR